MFHEMATAARAAQRQQELHADADRHRVAQVARRHCAASRAVSVRRVARRLFGRPDHGARTATRCAVTAPLAES